MKLRHLLFGLLAGVAFVACTNDDDPAGVSPVNGGDKVATAEKYYMKVNFVMPGGADTRADDAVFEAGSTDENQVNNGVLFFFDDGKTQVADPFIIDKNNPTWTAENEGANVNIEKKSGVIVVLENPLKNPTSVVAVLNATMDQLGVNKSSTLDDIKAVVKDFSATGAGKFVMSSSAYDGAVEKIAAAIPANKIYTSRKAVDDAIEAGEASVVIPVERVVAKVTVDTSKAKKNMANAETGKESNTVTINGEEVEITAEVKGWWLDNTASTSLLLKDISANKDGEVADGGDNDASNKRSYWAKPVPGTLKHSAWNVANADKMALPQYVQENVAVAEAAATDAQKANNYDATQVVVAVQLMAKATENAEAQPLQLVKYLGKLYTQTGFNTEAINVLAHKYWIVEEGKDPRTVGASDFNITYINTKTTTPALPEGVTLKDYQAYTLIEKADAAAVFYVKNAAGEYEKADATALANDMKGYVVQQWNNGMAYYFTAIKHDDTRKAVIRNHVYKVKVNSINGLGTPVPFSDSDEIIPIIPENTETYISAQIDILAWKIVENNVDLGK